ncbi:hypothetical protein GCM10020254_23120 [Streptomyces goshikiensis]
MCDVPQGPGHFGGGGPLRRLLAEQPGDDRRERAGPGRLRRFLVHDGPQGAQRGALPERGDPLHGRVQHHAEGPQVGLGARGAAQCPLRRQVLGGTDHFAGHRQGGAALDHRDPEVAQHHPAVLRDQHVRRLHVPVLHTDGVRGAQRVQHFGADVRGAPRGEGPLGPQQIGQ